MFIPLIQFVTFFSRSPTMLYGYVPDGLTEDQYNKIKQERQSNKKLGKIGPRGFKSRSFDSFLKAKERGEVSYNFPVNPKDIRSGKIALKDVPYMQRGGSWDNSDLSGKLGWTKTGFGMKAFNDGNAKQISWTEDDTKYDKSQKINKDKVKVVDKPRNSGFQIGWGGNEVQTGSKLNKNYRPPKINNKKQRRWFFGQ